jgi:hypothetical protein
MVYAEYPASGFNAIKGRAISFTLSGDERLTCKILLVKTGDVPLPEFTVTINGTKNTAKGKTIKNGHIEYLFKGNEQVRISWKR